MYDFRRINQTTILTHTLLIGLTPLIPIPFLDDWVKSAFQRRMIGQIAGARGQSPNAAEVDTLLEEGFGSCVGGCLYGLIGYPLSKLASKIFFFLEWRRVYLLISHTYYFGFLLDAALMDGFTFDGQKERAGKLREAIEQVKQNANTSLIQRTVKQAVQPKAMANEARQVFGRALRGLPRMIIALPGALWTGIVRTPGRVRDSFYHRIQVILGREKAPELLAIEKMAQSIQASLLNMPSDHFDLLRVRLDAALGLAAADLTPILETEPHANG